ncbi:MAG: peptidoglycan editing factor PgeF [Parvibaculales bacterium]
MKQTLSPITDSAWQTQPAKYGFFTRQGGVSTGLYQSLNLGAGSQDLTENVQENKQRIEHYFDDKPLVTLYQIHSNKVVTIRAQDPLPEQKPQADAIVSDRADIAIGVLSADCVPVLFIAPDTKLIGVAHAGWRGALGGIIDETVKSLVALGALKEQINALIGPAISQQNYEIDAAFRDRFLEENAENAHYFDPAQRERHYLFNLTAYVADKCHNAGCGRVNNVNLCTYADSKRFYSYRRSTHLKQADYGRQISAISLLP